MPKRNEREYRTMPVLAVRALEDEPAEGQAKSYRVKGYASTFNDPYVLYEDSDGAIYEQVDARAFDDADMSDVIFQFDHAGMVYARSSNGSLKVSTPQAYAQLDRLGIRKALPSKEDLVRMYRLPVKDWAFENDFEKVNQRPETEVCKGEKLYLSGSGSSWFKVRQLTCL